ncbi:MAG: bifunctional 23S rRNA (guanine(2069)-N(7))-methyltransferase RlmK/23S rRNA (guanine(2445)-N(2))-methyltransferase RlmL, partial [Pseudomonadota bacterium]|nr:bifunctional 23S rRNA (guanine(2069)-N(7))-methyltransferase RlmK/23S rRNA (guanine(2445)-N(2))-methyltransferase RlmL [Pseudomonadota bacterium]
AAGLLYAANWHKAPQGSQLIDPFCGAGTVLIEGALMAYQIAPGLLRRKFGFQGWKKHQDDRWQALRQEASKQRLDNQAQKPFSIKGFDADSRAISNTLENAERLGLAHLVHIERVEFGHVHKRIHDSSPIAIATNPPYGERLDEQDTIFPLYQFMQKQLAKIAPGAFCALISDHVEKVDALGLQEPQTQKVKNGNLNCYLRSGVIPEALPERLFLPKLSNNVDPGQVVADFANRLKKNFQKRKKWLERESIDCFRLYDADLPDYKLAIDWYHGYWHVQEYAAPKKIEPEVAAQRLNAAIDTLSQIFTTAKRYIYVKTRQQQKGKAQYNVQSQKDTWQDVQEFGANLQINLSRYLDTGLFLDHRPARTWVQASCQNKRFLNLFCYTGSVTVHAAKGGAKSSVSVDTSNTYLNWAKRNLLANGFSELSHQRVRANCMDFLHKDKNQYDVIFVDPPTFSNSKSRQAIFDVQRDHKELIELAMKRLEPGGVLYFSTNSRKFSLDETLAEQFDIKDVTQASIPLDFERKPPPIHYCWKIRFAQ